MASTVPQADLSNWRQSPHSEWAFQNVDKLIPTQTIKKSEQPSPLPSEPSPALEGLRIPIDQQSSLDLPTLLETTHTDGFVVLHRGKLVHEYYAHGNGPETRHILMSMTKSVVALVAGVLIESGVLGADDRVDAHLPELAPGPYAAVTVRHLLDMQSGVRYDDNSYAYRMAWQWDPVKAGEAQTDGEAFLAGFDAPADTPGREFVYLSVNTDLLGLLLERASGRRMAELVREYVWEPSGAEFDATMTVDGKGLARAAGGISATLRDVARVGQGLIEGRVGPKAWVEDILHGGDNEMFARSAWGPAFQAFAPGLAYRSCWTASGRERVVVALGIHGQCMVVDLKNELVMAKTSSQPASFDPMKSGLALRAFRVIQRALS